MEPDPGDLDEAPDYYELLGVPDTATQEEIRAAYQALANELHPENTDDPEATNKFQMLVEAYTVLKDPEKRKLYDAQGFFEDPRFQKGDDDEYFDECDEEEEEDDFGCTCSNCRKMGFRAFFERFFYRRASRSGFEAFFDDDFDRGFYRPRKKVEAKFEPTKFDFTPKAPVSPPAPPKPRISFNRVTNLIRVEFGYPTPPAVPVTRWEVSLQAGELAQWRTVYTGTAQKYEQNTKPNTQYSAIVRAFNGRAESPWSEVVSYTTEARDGSAPANRARTGKDSARAKLHIAALRSAMASNDVPRLKKAVKDAAELKITESTELQQVLGEAREMLAARNRDSELRSLLSHVRQGVKGLPADEFDRLIARIDSLLVLVPKESAEHSSLSNDLAEVRELRRAQTDQQALVEAAAAELEAAMQARDLPRLEAAIAAAKRLGVPTRAAGKLVAALTLPVTEPCPLCKKLVILRRLSAHVAEHARQDAEMQRRLAPPPLPLPLPAPNGLEAGKKPAAQPQHPLPSSQPQQAQRSLPGRRTGPAVPPPSLSPSLVPKAPALAPSPSPAAPPPPHDAAVDGQDGDDYYDADGDRDLGGRRRHRPGRRQRERAKRGGQGEGEEGEGESTEAPSLPVHVPLPLPPPPFSPLPPPGPPHRVPIELPRRMGKEPPVANAQKPRRTARRERGKARHNAPGHVAPPASAPPAAAAAAPPAASAAPSPPSSAPPPPSSMSPALRRLNPSAPVYVPKAASAPAPSPFLSLYPAFVSSLYPNDGPGDGDADDDNEVYSADHLMNFTES